MIKSEVDGAYLITHSYGEVIDGITWDESSAKFLVDKLNERCKKVNKCLECRKSNFKIGEETCDKAEIYFSSNGYGSRCATYCVNDVTDKLNKDYKYTLIDGKEIFNEPESEYYVLLYKKDGENWI